MLAAADPGIIRVPDDYPTIQEAINAANPGDTIEVAAGTYYEHLTISKPVTLKGARARTTIIDGNKTGVVVSITAAASNAYISGFTIRNGESYNGIELNDPGVKTISGITICDNILINNYVAIYLSYSTYNAISRNSILSNEYGIQLYCSNLNTITENTIDSSIFHGTRLSASKNNIISGNTFTNNEYGIHLEWSNNNNVSLNDITENVVYGVRLSYSSNNTVTTNAIQYSEYGVYIWNCSDNTFYYNNFIDNTIQVEHYEAPLTANTWDTNVCPGAEGNWWSDYTGEDDGTGVGRFGENRTANDGIGDTEIPHLGLDWYPLMPYYSPWAPIAPEPVAHFTHTPTIPIANKTATFNASKSYDGDGYIVSYDWDFGDETPIITEEDPITTHIYIQAGNYTATLTVTDNEGSTNSTTKEITVVPYRFVIDLYTQKEPYSGKGPNMPSDAFALGDLVNLTAYLTYNDEPAPNKTVTFEVIDPNNTTIFLGTSNTTENGLATTRFMLLTTATFGTYTAIAKGEIAEKTCNDTLTFKVGWIIEITKVETMDQYGNPKNIFTKGEQVYFDINVKNIAFTPKNVTLTVTIQDELSEPIGVTDLQTQIRPDHGELKLIFNIVIPEWSSVGPATAYTCAFTNWLWLSGVPYCPEMSTSLYIKAG